MPRQRRILFTLTGPHVVEWLNTHVSPPGSPPEVVAANTPGPLVGADLYQGSATWELPMPEDPAPASVRLIPYAVKAFREIVPDGKALLDKHESALKLVVEGGPR